MKTTTLLLSLFITTSIYSQNVFRLDSTQTFIADMSNNNQWNEQLRSYFQYENGGTKDTEMLQQIPVSMGWENLSRSLKTYNSNNDIALNQFQAWNPTDMMWVLSGSFEFLYNGDNLLETKNEYNFIGLIAVEEFAYDSASNVIEEIYKISDPITLTITNNERRTHQYNGSDVIEDVFQDWAGSDWLNAELREYTYGTNGFVSLIEKREWDSNDWGGIFEQTTFTYDGNNLPTQLLVEKDMGSGLQNSSRVLNTFDGANLTIILDQEWNGADWDNKGQLLQTFDTDANVTEQISQIWDSGGWLNQVRLLSFWSPSQSLSVTFINTFDINIYPNPAIDILQVQLSEASKNDLEVSLFDLSGRKLKTLCISKGTATFKIPITQQASGTYILKIRNSGNIQTFRVVKK